MPFFYVLKSAALGSNKVHLEVVNEGQIRITIMEDLICPIQKQHHFQVLETRTAGSGKVYP